MSWQINANVNECFRDLTWNLTSVPVSSPTFTIAWHPKKYLLAYACDEKHDRDGTRGTLKVFGFPSDDKWIHNLKGHFCSLFVSSQIPTVRRSITFWITWNKRFTFTNYGERTFTPFCSSGSRDDITTQSCALQWGCTRKLYEFLPIFTIK